MLWKVSGSINYSNEMVRKWVNFITVLMNAFKIKVSRRLGSHLNNYYFEIFFLNYKPPKAIERIHIKVMYINTSFFKFDEYSLLQNYSPAISFIS